MRLGPPSSQWTAQVPVPEENLYALQPNRGGSAEMNAQNQMKAVIVLARFKLTFTERGFTIR